MRYQNEDLKIVLGTNTISTIQIVTFKVQKNNKMLKLLIIKPKMFILTTSKIYFPTKQFTTI